MRIFATPSPSHASTHSKLRFGLIGIAGLFMLCALPDHLRAAPDVAPSPLPPGIQPIPMPELPDTKQLPDQKPPAAEAPKDGASVPPQPVPQDAQGKLDLDTLFARLHDAKTEDEAKLVNLMIEAQMLQSGSDTIDLLMFRALAAVQNQEIPLAMDLLDTIIALKPDYAEGWNKRATLYFMTRDYGKAISDVEMVLRLQPRHYAALIGLAQMLSELGDKKHALEALKRVLVIYPLNSGVAKAVADLEAALGGRDL